MSANQYRIGIDLGGTKIEAAVLDSQNQVLFRERIPTEAKFGPEHILNQIHLIYQQACEEIRNELHSLGLGTPGSISNKTGLLKNSNTTCLNGLPLQQLLEQKIGRSLIIENDANCFALAEATLGAGKGYELVFGVILGTGCGGGIVIDGKIRKGSQHIAGEWGHMTIDPNGPICYCGKKGCVETLISGSGLEHQYLSLAKQKISAHEIFQLSLDCNPIGKSLINKWHINLGRSLSNVINILDPNIIVLGGGLSNDDSLYKEGIEQVRNFVFNDQLTTFIVKNKLGDSAGVLGATLLD